MRRMLAALVATIAWAGSAGAEEPVAVELVLAVDRSASMTGGGLEFELRGHAAAFREPVVADAISGVGGIAVTLVSWSSPQSLRVVVPWTRVDGPEDAAAFADAIDAAPRDAREGNTAIGSAIVEAAALFEGNGYAGTRQVIDLVGNGFSNAGIDPAEARDLVAARGVTVNALAIRDEFDWLEEYFAENVVGGPSAFVRGAEDRGSFEGALLGKLVAEIALAPEPGGD